MRKYAAEAIKALGVENLQQVYAILTAPPKVVNGQIVGTALPGVNAQFAYELRNGTGIAGIGVTKASETDAVQYVVDNYGADPTLIVSVSDLGVWAPPSPNHRYCVNYLP